MSPISTTIENMVRGVSGVARKAAAVSGIASQTSAAKAPTRGKSKSRAAPKPIIAGLSANATTSSARTPNSEGPKTSVESRIHPRDHRRVVEIAESKSARPQRIVGLVEAQLEFADDRELGRGQGQRQRESKRGSATRSPKNSFVHDHTLGGSAPLSKRSDATSAARSLCGAGESARASKNPSSALTPRIPEARQTPRRFRIEHLAEVFEPE